MRFEFTPAAERALAVAAGWTSRADANELYVPEVLLGLLAEPECRAALLLAPLGIDDDAVRERFPDLRPVAPPNPVRANDFSPALLACLHAAESLLVEYPRPLALATEHLLLGLVAVSNDASAWLNQRGLHAEPLMAEVHRLSGHRPGPLPMEVDDAGPPDESPLDDAPPAVDRLEAIAGEPTPAEQIAALRIVDAAANRAGEGLRVIEDYLRFALDDRHLTAHCKSIRHELTTALEIFPAEQRHAARDTRADVGTNVSLPTEQVRADTAAVLQASFKRVEQALRSLEEFSKTCDPQAAATLEQLRYRVYTIERAVDITHRSLERLSGAQLYVLIPAGSSPEALRALVEGLLFAGVGVIQLRDKTLDDRQLVTRGRLVAELTHDTNTLFIMNDRADLAVACGADGVHLGQEDLSVKDARRILGPTGLIGVSTHSLEQARGAVLDGANYIGVGPTFPSGTKAFRQFPGTELLAAVQAEIRLPAFAIGGITADNLRRVLATGFTRVAVSGAITGAADPAAAAESLNAGLRSVRS